MIRLTDSILIHVPPERVWAFLDDLPARYREWHEDHLTCRFEQGKRLEVGTVLYVEERLHGSVHRLRLRATEVVPDRLMRYRNHGFTGAFLLEPTNGGTRFTAELRFGITTPVIGSLLDVLLRAVLGHRLAAFQSHMREEGENLRRLLESGARRSESD
jgi:hypothetical protein